MQESIRVKICTLDVDMASVIGKNSRENLKAFLHRIGVVTEDHLGKEELCLALKEAILEHPEYILYIHSMEALLFLLELWESDEMEFTQEDLILSGQLRLLGFLDFSMEEGPGQKEGTIYLIREAKEYFYFYLRSRQAAKQMEQYEIWERLIRGMMTCYGIISFNRLYFYFCKCVMEPVDDENLHRFLASRVSLWSFGSLVMEKNSKIEYYENFEVTDPEAVLELCQEDQKRNYKPLEFEEALYIADNNGLGRWKGIREIADLLMDEVQVEYYQTVVVIKSCVLQIQNGDSVKDTLSNLLKWCPQAVPYKERLEKELYLLYDSVPVYQLKGWTREEEKPVSKKQPLFTVLQGGKREEKKGKHKKN